MYGLKEEHIKAINSVFSKYTQIEKAILYGSRAKGNYRNGSDIDLTLVGKNLDISTLFKIEIELDDLMLAYKIDISILHKTKNPSLVENISRVGITFYEKTVEHQSSLHNLDKPEKNKFTDLKNYTISK